MGIRRISLVCCLLVAGAARAAATDPAATVDAFHQALHDGQGQAALSYMDANVSIYEQGFVEANRDAYKKDQLNQDIAFAKVTSYQVLDRRILWMGDAACVISHTRAKGAFSGQTVDLIGTETMILRKAGDAWLIAHAHWSAHPADQEAG